MSGVRELIREIHRRSVWQVVLVYLGGSWVALQVVESLTDAAGLPEWFPAFAVGLLVIGFPIVLATALVQEGGPRPGAAGAASHDEAVTPPPAEPTGSANPIVGLLTWRHAIGGGVLAFALWGVVAAGWLALGPGTVATLSADEAPMLGVLPVRNLSADGADAGFAEGVHGDIIAQASKIRDIRVLSARSMLAYRDPDGRDMMAIASELDADFLLESSLQLAGDEMRMTVSLVDGATGETVWSEPYQEDMTLDGVFEIQARIATGVAAQLTAELSLEEAADIEARPTDSEAAWAEYQRARAVGRYNFSRDSTLAEIAALERAVAIDPDFAVAWARLSRMHDWMWWSFGVDQRDAGAAALARAMELDPDAPEVQVAEALSYYRATDFETALAMLTRLEEIRPSDPEILAALSYTWRRLGNRELSTGYILRALDLDPDYPNYVVTLAQNRLALGGVEGMTEALDRLPPNDPAAFSLRALHLLSNGDTAGVSTLVSITGREHELSQPASVLLLLPGWTHQTANQSGGAAPFAFAVLALREGDFEALRVQRDYLTELTPSVDLDDVQPNIREAGEVAQAWATSDDPATSPVIRAPILAAADPSALNVEGLDVWNIFMALIYEAHDIALDQIEASLRHPSIITTEMLEVVPLVDGLRDLPRYQEIIAEARARGR